MQVKGLLLVSINQNAPPDTLFSLSEKVTYIDSYAGKGPTFCVVATDVPEETHEVLVLRLVIVDANRSRGNPLGGNVFSQLICLFSRNTTSPSKSINFIKKWMKQQQTPPNFLP